MTPSSGSPSSCGTVAAAGADLGGVAEHLLELLLRERHLVAVELRGLAGEELHPLAVGRPHRADRQVDLLRVDVALEAVGGSLKWLSASLIGYGSVFSGMRCSSEDLVSLGNCNARPEVLFVAPTPAQPDVEELSRLIAADEIDTVVVAFPDLQGRLMGKRVTGRFFRDHVLDHGIDACSYLLAVDVDMTPLPGYQFASWETGYGDVLCKPDLGTLRVLPWLDKTALVLCDLFDESTGDAVEVAPRQILRRQIARAREAGYTIKCGSELEFLLFRDSYEEAQASGYAGLTPHSAYVEDYHVLQTTRDEYLIRAIRNGVDNAGIPVEFSKGEAGLGQHEINLEYAEALEMADRHVIYKNAAKEIAGLHGRSLTFMAKYDMGGPGSSCHIHSSVWDAGGDTPLMHDPAAPEGMSDVFRGWLGGSLALSQECAWLFAPT